MKSVLLISITLTWHLFVSGQKTIIGFHAGFNYAFSKGGMPDGAKVGYIPGIAAGILIDKKIGAKVSLQPALNFIQKGAKEEGSGSAFFYDYKSKIRLNYIELPFNFLYRAPGGFFAGGGPVLSLALSGSYYYQYTNENGEVIVEDRKVKFYDLIEIMGSSDGDAERYEAGINVMTGITFKNNLFISANFNYGLTHSINNTNSLYLGVRIGYMFKEN